LHPIVNPLRRVDVSLDRGSTISVSGNSRRKHQ